MKSMKASLVKQTADALKACQAAVKSANKAGKKTAAARQQDAEEDAGAASLCNVLIYPRAHILQPHFTLQLDDWRAGQKNGCLVTYGVTC